MIRERWGRLGRGRRILVMVAVAVVLLVLTRETTATGLEAFTTERQSTVGSGFFVLDRFKGVSQVQVVGEDGRTEVFDLGDGDHLLRLSVEDRISSWPLTHLLPFVKWGASEHRVYFKVENNARGLGWNTWAMVVKVEGEVEQRMLGLAPSSTYRREALEPLLDLDRDDFDFLREE